MKKNKKIFALVATLLSSVSIAGCSDVSEKSGVLLTYNGVDYKADDLFKHFENDKTSSETMFEAVYKVAVRSYFKNGASETLIKKVARDATNDVTQAKQDAQNNADTNGTSYNEEFIKILKDNDSTDESTLYDHYEYSHMKEEFNEVLYDNNLDVLQNGGDDGKNTIKIGSDKTSETFDGNYLNEKFPYHVRHILVKTDNSSSTPYREKISAEQAKKLYNVVYQLGLGQNSFGQIAKTYSEDEGSAANFGDLGIMDKDTSFVNEFKLGIYTFDALFNSEYNTKNEVKNKLGLSDMSEVVNTFTTGTNFKKDAGVESELDNSNFLSEIFFSRFKELNSVAETEKDANGSKVCDGAEELFPRNIYFNLFFNNKNMSLITDNGDNVGNTKDDGKVFVKKSKSDTTKCGFLKASDVKGFDSTWGITDSDNTFILVDEYDNPILAFKSGTGSSSSSSEEGSDDSSSSGYKGIHLVSIIRGGFDTTSEPKAKEYWTYYYPGEDKYPENDDGSDKDTYVNFIKSETKDYKKRADEVKNKIKSYQSNFDTYVYKALVNKGSLKIADTDQGKILSNNIDKYIDLLRKDTKNSNSKTWKETWVNWAKEIKNETAVKYTAATTQGVEATDEGFYKFLFSETCAVKFSTGNAADKAFFEPGGMCYYKK